MAEMLVLVWVNVVRYELQLRMGRTKFQILDRQHFSSPVTPAR